MNVPKWEKPTWIGLTPQKIRSMSEVEIRGMLKQACSSIQMMPDHVPYKKYMVELGEVTLRLNNYSIKIEKGVSDEELEKINKIAKKEFEKAIGLMEKVIMMQKNPHRLIQGIVEIMESNEEDPWDTSCQPTSSPSVEEINKTPEDFDPWSSNNEF